MKNIQTKVGLIFLGILLYSCSINKFIPDNLVERYALVDIVSYMEAEEAVA